MGVIHTVFGVAALVLGLGVVALRKGTSLHRRVGLVYVCAMAGLNGTAFLLYDLWGRWGPFHTLAVVSLVSVGAGVLSVWIRRPRGRWLGTHATFMAWSYAGVVAAFFSEIGSRLPGVGFLPGVAIPTTVVMVAAAVLIHTRVPRIIAEMG